MINTYIFTSVGGLTGGLVYYYASAICGMKKSDNIYPQILNYGALVGAAIGMYRGYYGKPLIDIDLQIYKK